MSCPEFQDPNSTVFNDVRFSEFAASFDRNAVCGASTYIRADEAGALLPWLYTLILLLVHLPVAIIRVKKWERVQMLSLFLAVTAVALKTQQFASTGLAPDKILVWMPVAMALDFGAMLQIHVLIVEESGYPSLAKAFGASLLGLGRQLRENLLTSCRKSKAGAGGQSPSSSPPIFSWLDPSLTVGYTVTAHKDIERISTASEERVASTRQATSPAPPRATAGRAALAFCALALTLAILILQAIALDKVRRSFDITSTVKWCSPAFQSSSVAILDGNCNLRKVVDAAAKGLGCVPIPAYYQEDWLRRVFGILTASLAVEFSDCLILVLTGSKKLKSGLELQRPWLTVSRLLSSLTRPLSLHCADLERLADVLRDHHSRRPDGLWHHGCFSSPGRDH